MGAQTVDPFAVPAQSFQQTGCRTLRAGAGGVAAARRMKKAQQLLEWLAPQLQSLLRRLPSRWRSVLSACVYGSAAGVSAVAFQLGMNWLYKGGLVQLSRHSLPVFLCGSFVLIIGTSLIV